MNLASHTLQKYKEPTIRQVIKSYDGICAIDQGIMLSKLEDILAKRLFAASFQTLAKETLGFIDPPHQKRYFTAMYLVLDKLVNQGSVEKIKTPLGSVYAMVPQACAAHAEKLKNKAAASMRKDPEEEFKKFLESGKTL